MAYTTIDNPELYFQVKTYTGNATDDTAITLDGSENMQPDMIWFKDRTNANHGRIFDSVRGVTKNIYPSLTNSEGTTSSELKSFDSDGFTLGTGSDVNGNNANLVAWSWKCETAFTNDASSTGVGTIDTAGQANNTAGISIATWTGTGNVGTIKHGLSSIPKWAMIKNRSEDARHWNIYHEDINNTHYFQFDTNAKLDDAGVFDDTSPTSSVMTLGASNRGNENTKSHIGYFFSEVQGYSKFGSYTGNGNADGTFIYTGFSPSMVIFKNTAATQDWVIKDNKRPGFNQVNDVLYPNGNYAEGHGADIDFLSNGFKCRTTADNTNQNGSAFVYMAFAESPFVSSSGVPTTAR
jgi:hypothetical protein